MGDVMQLPLRQFYSSPGHAVQDVGIGTAGAFRVGEVPEGGRLQFLADAFEVHSIRYYASSAIGMIPQSMRNVAYKFATFALNRRIRAEAALAEIPRRLAMSLGFSPARKESRYGRSSAGSSASKRDSNSRP
jgi:hypothetical protein